MTHMMAIANIPIVAIWLALFQADSVSLPSNVCDGAPPPVSGVVIHPLRFDKCTCILVIGGAERRNTLLVA